MCVCWEVTSENCTRTVDTPYIARVTCSYYSRESGWWVFRIVVQSACSVFRVNLFGLLTEKRSSGVVRTSGTVSNPWPPEYEAAVIFPTMSLVYKVSFLLWITVRGYIRPLHWSYSKYGIWPSLAAGIFSFDFNELKMFFVTGRKGACALSMHVCVQHTSACTQYGNAVRYILNFIIVL